MFQFIAFFFNTDDTRTEAAKPDRLVLRRLLNPFSRMGDRRRAVSRAGKLIERATVLVTRRLIEVVGVIGGTPATSMPRTSLDSLLARGRPILLDGAVGTELFRRGIPTPLPLWSGHALLSDQGMNTLVQIHREYARAGAEVAIANTFRTTLRVLRKAGRQDAWRLLNERAVAAARSATSERASQPLPVAGGIAPLEDCYRPDLVPPQDQCFNEHRRQVELFVELGVDLIIIETMNCLREALAALTVARQCKTDALLSLCPRPPGHLLSGEPLDEAVPELVSHGGSTLRALLLNCASPAVLELVYPRFCELVGALPHGLYAHLGEPEETGGWKFCAREQPDDYARWMAKRLDEGAHFVGGCCGTTPAHIAADARMFNRRNHRAGP